VSALPEIEFNKPFMTGRELAYIARAHERGQLAGDGEFTERCHKWLKTQIGCKRALLTHSCTAALEMAAILGNIGEGDEVIMPSYTFVSTANAFVLRGAIPVFVDIREDTLNIDESLIESAISDRTRAIVVMHYAGVACEMDTILEIARRYNLMVIEDAAQAIESTYRKRPLGSIGDIGALSFHETKNVISGEGGAILLNRIDLQERAEIIREKGTNRNQFFRGQVDKYTWVDIGSSFLPSEMVAAFLWAQLEDAEQITARRRKLWNNYHHEFQELEHRGLVRLPICPKHSRHGAHMYYLLLPDLPARTKFISQMHASGIRTVFHYVPLHSSPMGRKFCRSVGALEWSTRQSERLVRLPMWIGMEKVQERIIESVKAAV
jgi:dTDP-4-amino-4,6-dideoxygalactose transaminase